MFKTFKKILKTTGITFVTFSFLYAILMTPEIAFVAIVITWYWIFRSL